MRLSPGRLRATGGVFSVSFRVQDSFLPVTDAPVSVRVNFTADSDVTDPDQGNNEQAFVVRNHQQDVCTGIDIFGAGDDELAQEITFTIVPLLLERFPNSRT